LVFDGSTWSTSYDGAQECIYSPCVYNGKLYAGQGYGTGDGDVLVFDGSTWSTSYDGAQEGIYSLCVYNGKLYAGQGYGAGDGDVYVLQTVQTLTLDAPLSRAYTNPIVRVTQQFALPNLATNVQVRVECDVAGGASNTVIRVATEVLR